MKPYRLLLKRLLIIIILDISLLGAFNWYLKPEPSISIAELLIIPFIIIINLLVALCAHFWFSKMLKNIMLMNAVIASLISHWMFAFMVRHYDDQHYKSYYFKLNKQQYELCLSKMDTTYSFSILHSGSSISWTGRPYIIRHDTTLLTDSGKHYMVYKNRLFDYPKPGNIIVLSNQR